MRAHVAADDELEPREAHAIVRQERQGERFGRIRHVHHDVRSWIREVREACPLDTNGQPTAIDESLFAFRTRHRYVPASLHRRRTRARADDRRDPKLAVNDCRDTSGLRDR